jgi:hypothetical protein
VFITVLSISKLLAWGGGGSKGHWHVLRETRTPKPGLRNGVRVCVYYCSTDYKAVRVGGEGIVEDMCYERRRLAGEALGPVRDPVLQHRVRLLSLVPLVWESNPTLQGGWCKTKPPAQLPEGSGVRAHPGRVVRGIQLWRVTSCHGV